MQDLDFQAFFQHFNLIFLASTACACLAILFSRIPAFIKLPVISCVFYAGMLVAYPEQVEHYLGASRQSLATALFLFAVGCLAYSFYKFLRAGMTIVFWLLITAVIGATAFPNIINQDLARGAAEGDLPGQYLQSRVVGYLNQHLSFHQ